MQWEGRARAALGQPEIPDADLSEVFGKLPPRQVGMGACLEELFFAAQRCKPPRAWPNPLAEAAHTAFCSLLLAVKLWQLWKQQTDSLICAREAN